MADFDINDYKSSDYNRPEEDYVFQIRGREYQGFTYVYDQDSVLFKVLDFGDNFLNAIRGYYKMLHNVELPDVKLFVIDAPNSVNAFARYEKSLNAYCIGVFSGACYAMEKNVEESFKNVLGVLIPEEKAEIRYGQIFIQAIRFFVAHEYAHIVCGHVTENDEDVYLEFADDPKSDEENLLQQMKEFQADQMAMAFLYGMAYQDADNRVRISMKWFEENEKRMWNEYQPNVPDDIRKLMTEGKPKRYRSQLDEKMKSMVHHDLQMIMGGVNVAFYTMDCNRKNAMKTYAKEHKITKETQESFYFQSGLATIKKFDHPLPSIRLDAVIRIMDENIERNEPIDKIEQWENDVADFVWVVEIHRNEFNLGELYCHIAHTPTAQDFIQEMDQLWQKEKNKFPALLPPLERLVYANRIVDMSDEGVLIR